MSVKNFISVLCVILYSVYQVSSLKCYNCVTPLDGECFKNPKKKEHEFTCPETKTADFSNISGITILSALTNISVLDGSDVSYAAGPFDCCTLTGSGLGTKFIHRSCQPKSSTDEDIKKVAKALGIEFVDSLRRCDTDLCNSNSDNPSAQSTPLPGSSSSTSPDGSSSKSPPASSSKAPPASSSKAPSSTSTTTSSPGSFTTSSPGSSSTISIEFWCLAGSLFSIIFTNCKSIEFTR